MQCIKESSTLRLGTKEGKPCPRIVYRFGKQDGEIKSYLEFGRIIRSAVRKVEHG
jgi:antitoxin component YwqK of YwqJK toxin-antitoxin module